VALLTDGDATVFQFRRLSLREAYLASRWRYEGEYALYNLNLTPMLIGALLSRPSLKDINVTCYAVGMANDPLVAVFSLIRRRDDVEVGVGIRPDLNGRGHGLPLMLEGLAEARERYHPKTFSLNVATFNRRAILTYERAGFVPGPTKPLTFRGTRYEEMHMSRPAE
jgi:ribosomal-protein-alanine N-acetyltransferase